METPTGRCWFVMLALLLGGWMLSLARTAVWARVVVMLSPPVGALFGGFCGFQVCRFSFRLSGVPESQHEWLAWSLAALLGAVIGCLLLTAVTWFLTNPKRKDESSLPG